MAASSTSSSDRPRVLLCRSIPTTLLDDAERSGSIQIIRRPEAEHDSPASARWIVDNAKQADAIVVTLTERVDQSVLDAAPKLQIVSTMSVGTDHIDVEEVKKRQIKLGSTPEVLDQAVAELTLLLILNVTRNVPHAARVVAEGHWKDNPWSPLAFCGPTLENKTVGFIGFGNIAQSVAALLPAFRPARILYTTSKPKPFDPAHPDFARLRQRGFPTESTIKVENEPDRLALARQSDVIVVLTSLNAHTKHLVNREFFAQMKPTAVVVNTSRGPVVDTDALVHAITERQIWAAGLDVLEGEPNVLSDHPLLSSDACRDRVMILPHIGSATFEARKAMADLTARHVLDHFHLS